VGQAKKSLPWAAWLFDNEEAYARPQKPTIGLRRTVIPGSFRECGTMSNEHLIALLQRIRALAGTARDLALLEVNSEPGFDFQLSLALGRISGLANDAIEDYRMRTELNSQRSVPAD
jgi:hypothetical protein